MIYLYMSSWWTHRRTKWNYYKNFINRWGWVWERRIGGCGREGVIRCFQLTLFILWLGGIVRWMSLWFSVSYGVVKLYLQPYSLLGEWWRIRLLLWSIWKDEGCWLKVPCVVCVGRRKSFTVTCFSTAVLLGGSRDYALNGWECRSCLTMIPCQTLLN